MSKQTLQERFAAALLKGGEKELRRTSKYIVFSRTVHLSDRSGINGFYYLGKAGSVRVGRTIADSVPLLDNTKKRLLESIA